MKNIWILILLLLTPMFLHCSVENTKELNISFNPPAGTYTKAQNIEISSDIEGAVIRYTIDGTEPTISSGTLYTSEIEISKTTTLKAIAHKGDIGESNVVTADYEINSGGGGDDPEDLPKPTSLIGKCIDNNDKVNIKLMWETSTDSKGYKVYRNNTIDGEYTEIVNNEKTQTIGNVTKLRFTDESSLNQGNIYYYKVKEYSGEVESPLSDPLEVSSELPEPPTIPEANSSILLILGELKNSSIDTEHPDRLFFFNTESDKDYVVEWDETGNNYGSDLLITIFSDDLDNPIYYSQGINEGPYYLQKERELSAKVYIKVEPTNSSDIDFSIKVDSIDTVPTNNKPYNVVASSDYDDKLSIEWDVDWYYGSMDDVYYVYRSESFDSGYSPILITSLGEYELEYTSYKYAKDKNVYPGVTYYYKVGSIGGNGIISMSDSYDSAMIPAPDVSNVTASINGDDNFDFVELGWDYSFPPIPERYYIFRSENESGPFTRINISDSHIGNSNSEYTTNSLAYDWTALPDVTYYYKIQPYKYYPNVDFEYFKDIDNITAVNGSIQTIPIPTNLTASDNGGLDASEEYIKLNWDYDPDVERYYIYRSDTVDGTYTQINTSDSMYSNDPQEYSTHSSAYDWDVLPAVTYYYKIKAYRHYTETSTDYYTDFSNSNAGSLDVYIPTPPENVSASKADDIMGASYDWVKIEWTMDTECPRYYIYRSENASGPYTQINTSDSQVSNDPQEYTTYSYAFDWTALPGVTYYYKVKSANTHIPSGTVYYSDFSNYDDGSIKVITPPSIGIDDTWMDFIEIDVSSTSGTGEDDRYYVYRSETIDGTYTQINVSTSYDYDTDEEYITTWTDPANDWNAVPGVTYYYKVKAYKYYPETNYEYYTDFSNRVSGSL